jgi:hypothetical protein
MPPPLLALHEWLDSWRGIGFIVTGMARQGCKVSLREVDAWVATFYNDPITSAAGFASASTSWVAVQRAAWAALPKIEFGATQAG